MTSKSATEVLENRQTPSESKLWDGVYFINYIMVTIIVAAIAGAIVMLLIILTASLAAELSIVEDASQMLFWWNPLYFVIPVAASPLLRYTVVKRMGRRGD